MVGTVRLVRSGVDAGSRARAVGVNVATSTAAATLVATWCPAGGSFLLDVGPDAADCIPPLRRPTLEQIADRMDVCVLAAHDESGWPARLSAEAWVRCTRTGEVAHAVVAGRGGVPRTRDG